MYTVDELFLTDKHQGKNVKLFSALLQQFFNGVSTSCGARACHSGDQTTKRKPIGCSPVMVPSDNAFIKAIHAMIRHSLQYLRTETEHTHTPTIDIQVRQFDILINLFIYYTYAQTHCTN